MPTRRIFVKRAAGTALFFGAGINLANAAAVTSNNSGGTCGINQYELSGQYYCEISCSPNSTCNYSCTKKAGGSTTGSQAGGPDGVPTGAVLCG